jgi:hypothetical protein
MHSGIIGMAEKAAESASGSLCGGYIALQWLVAFSILATDFFILKNTQTVEP